MPEAVDLGAKRPSLHDGTDASVVLDRLLWVLREGAPVSEPDDLATFKNKLLEYRKGFGITPPGPDLANLAHSCLKTCEQYLSRSQQHVKNRDSELLDLITLLRTTAAAMVDDSAGLNAQLIASTDTFVKLTQMDDVRELKRLLTAEVATMRTAIEAKRQRDEQAYSKLTTRVETLQSRLTKAEQEASVDPLTRIANRGAFDRAIRKALTSAEQSGTPIALAIVDIDDFKVINDTHGHPIGDRVLVNTALWLGRITRKTDFIARYGGEEFTVILHDTKASQVEQRLSQALKELADSSFEYEASGQRQRIKYTASIGVTELAEGDLPADLVRRADEAMYEAKRKGKNRVVTKKRSLLASLLSRPRSA